MELHGCDRDQKNNLREASFHPHDLCSPSLVDRGRDS
ncbi:hypothetical protein CCACVL1_18794 [Corchorus capsularis]|uniref:Uncharacterized protein n=1 Tax=Corchorus capsularis TaxID=210143 RepID=A0A1R3HJN3_COCAP|nr:hypothetical protein CCACVL1_18794 [Corchorus capsularis]